MAVTKLNEYLPGQNLTNLALNVDYNRLGCDMTDISINFGTSPYTVTIAEGSIIECNGNLYAITGSDYSFQAANNTHPYLTFTDNPSVAFSSSAAVGTFSALKSGFYQSGNIIRTLKWYVDQSGSAYYLDEEIEHGQSQNYKVSNLDVVGGTIEMGGGTIEESGTPINGFMYVGTPLYSRRVSGTILDGLNQVSILHGISNAVTNDRVVSVCPLIDTATGVVKGLSSDSDDDIPYWFNFDDLAIRVRRGSTTGSYTVYCYFQYK